MLGPDRVRELLLAADPREFLWLTAADYFERALDPAPLTADDIFDLKRPPGEDHQLYELLPRVAPSERTEEELPRLLLGLKDCGPLLHSIVLGLVPHAPWLVEAARSPWLSLTLRRSIDRARDLCAVDFPRLWSEFIICADRWEPFAPARTFTTADYNAWFHAFDMRREELTVALMQHGPRASAATCDLLAESRGRAGVQFCAVDLLSRRPHSDALEPILALLEAQPSHDLMWKSVDALSRIGTVGVIRRAAESHRATRAPGLLPALGRVRHPEMERTLLEILGEERDPHVRMLVVEVLCSAFPTAGFEEMLDVVLSDEYPGQEDDGILLEAVVSAARVVGFESPRLPVARALLRTLAAPWPIVETLN